MMMMHGDVAFLLNYFDHLFQPGCTLHSYPHTSLIAIYQDCEVRCNVSSVGGTDEYDLTQLELTIFVCDDLTSFLVCAAPCGLRGRK